MSTFMLIQKFSSRDSEMTSENKGYASALREWPTSPEAEKYFSNQWCCIPQQAVEAVNDLLASCPDDRERGSLLTVTNNNSASRLINLFLAGGAARPATAADTVKDSINIVAATVR